MARFPLLYAVLGFLVLAHAQEQLPQHVLTGQTEPKPLPQAAKIVREKYV
jgi:hypothetical protein